MTNAGAPADLAAYYSARAHEYERVYAKPERQADLAQLHALVPPYFRDRNVLEVACGTGYWTALIAPVAASVLATDVSLEVLDVARAKALPAGRVRFQVADACDLAGIPGDFDAALAGFWWSHVHRNQLRPFLRGLHERLGGGARVMMMDNRFVEGSNIPIARTDDTGNSFQRRQLADGTEFEVLKNFPSPDEVQTMVEESGGRSVEVQALRYYWIVTYEVARDP